MKKSKQRYKQIDKRNSKGCYGYNSSSRIAFFKHLDFIVSFQKLYASIGYFNNLLRVAIFSIFKCLRFFINRLVFIIFSVNISTLFFQKQKKFKHFVFLFRRMQHNNTFSPPQIYGTYTISECRLGYFFNANDTNVANINIASKRNLKYFFNQIKTKICYPYI